VNEATVQVTGVPREKLMGTHFPDYFTEPEKAEEAYRQAFYEGVVGTTRLLSSMFQEGLPMCSICYCV